ncbi:MAG: DUF4215 domain-containing protein [Nanoarchaeota archaeon]|nr:DUF4215 domain-containing protein [Nanoarchaeota archaeon]
MSPKETVKKNTRYSPQYVPASKPKSKTFVIIAITVAALLVLGAFLFFNNQFVGKAIGAQCKVDADCGLGEMCSSGQCVQEPQFSCLNAPQNALLCPGEGTGLVQNTQSILVLTCGQYGPTEKCGFTCNDGYHVQAGQCVANVCGDWQVNQASEQCDDGNVVNGDGCSATCQNEQQAQFSCLNAPQNALLCSGEGTGLVQNTQSILVLTCGQYGPTEKCGFTCNSGYHVQAGQCVANVCGDWQVNQASEQCDDGNVVNGDGCSATCQMEAQDQLQGSPDQVLCQQIIDAPAKDKDLVGGVLNALGNQNKLDAILDIFTALNNWLKP